MANKINNSRPKAKAHTTKPTNVTGRLLCMLLVFVILLSYVGLYRVFAIKADGKDYEKSAIYNQVNRIQDKIVSPNRGDIVDRNGEPLAVGETVFNIILDVRLMVEQKQDKQEETINNINKIVGIPVETIRSYVALDANKKPAKDTHYFILAKKVPISVGRKINDLNCNWLYAEQDTKRSYPHGTLAAQVIGFTRGEASWGIESVYNDDMTGIPGRTFRTYERNGSIVTQRENPVKGNKLVTTLDANIQQFAEDVCKTAYDAYDPEYTDSIVMNPKTGEIYAMAQYPSFDLNDPMKLTDLGKTNISSTWDKMTDKQKNDLANKAWKNFAITDTFEPGSIYKPIVVAMALEEGVIKSTDSFYCGGVKKIADYEIHCHNRNGHGTLSLTGVLAQSCNIGMMEIITKLGAEKYLQYQHDFGFGEKTGIDLPNEASASNLLYSLSNLHSAEMATSSFGQGFNCTPIQAITAFSSIINGGKLMRPYVVSQVVDNDGNIVKENSPQVVRSVVSKETSDFVRTAMEDVFTEGTGKKAAIQGYAFGGKTGTAQQGDRSKQKYTLSFIAYHSIEDPNIICLTLIHKPANYSDVGGAATPVPMMKTLLEKIINYEAIPPDNDGKSGIAKVDTAQNYTVKDYTKSNLKSTIETLIDEGIDFEVIGSGDTIAKQSPAGGTQLKAKPSKLLLSLSNSGKTTLVPVPDVTGLSASDAKRMLESSGFKCSVADDSNSNSDEKETYAIETTTHDPLEDVETTTEEKSDTDTSKSDKTKTTTSTGNQVYVQMPSANVKVESGTTVRARIK